mmetsp:Transcript_16039/g.24186  ORF Transcript_16039/g.24186 Transcript_16039/m.24186 type:complete len:457 (+) Transcript_16039:62-1432(+)
MSSKKKSSSKSDTKKSSSKKTSSKDSKDSKGKSPSVSTSVPEGSSDFEAGILFNKYDPHKTGSLSAEAFRQMWKEAKYKLDENTSSSQVNGGVSAFDAGTIFAKFDSDADGKLDKKDFEAMVTAHPELLLAGKNRGNTSGVPHEVVTGRMLTHYDETAGVAIPRSSVQAHEAMGNTVLPLVQAYKNRYDRLRMLLTSKLLPRRETFLQLRRQLVNASSDVEAARQAIERETVADMERIVERLRAVESRRQSSIHHQMLQLDDELETMERLVKRVEVANSENQIGQGVTVSSAGVMAGSRPGHVRWADGEAEMVTAPRADRMVELIQQYADISSAIDRAASKPVTVQVDFPTDDFPKEISDRLEVVARCDKYAHALAVKDQMLWMALKDKEKSEEALEQEKKLSSEYANEIAEWAELAHSLKIQLKQSEEEIEDCRMENSRLVELLREHNIYYQPQY